MNQIKKSVLALATLLSGPQLFADTTSATYYSMRPQNTDTVREAVGFQEKIYRYDTTDKFNGAWGLVLQYSQTFNPGDIARSLFADDISCNSSCGSTLNISGSLVSNRGSNDWLADYFGLPQDYRGSVTFNPRIQNVIFDVEFYFGLDQWASGLYARLNLPVNWTRWKLCPKETTCDAGTCSYPAGYFAQEVVPNDDLLSSPLDFFTGAAAPTLSAASDETTSDIYGNVNSSVFDKLKYAKWGVSNDCECSDNSKTRLAAVEMVLGYNFLLDEDYYLGFNIRSSAPTGNAPKGEYLFEPIVGNGKHWELGGGLDAHYVFWRADDSEKTFSAYLDVNVVHLFHANQCRTFDLCGSNNSRYMLAQKMTPANALFGTSAVAGSDESDVVASPYQFAGEFAPVANLTISKVSVSSAVEGDLMLKFAYANGKGLIFDFGYNFWARSTEKICRKGYCGSTDPLNGQTWALKGDAFVYGYASGVLSDYPSGTVIDNHVVALGATESLATIHGGTNAFYSDTCTGTDNYAEGSIPYSNPGIDNAAYALLGNGITGVNEPVVIYPTFDTQTHSSNPPIMLCAAQLNLSGIKGLSNRVFAHFDYSWQDHETWTPFLGIGGSAEFGSSCNGFNFDCSSGSGDCTPCNTGCPATTDLVSSSSSACGTSCNTGCDTGCGSSSSGCSTGCSSPSSCCSSSSSDYGSFKAAVSQWSLWLKGGIAWN